MNTSVPATDPKPAAETPPPKSRSLEDLMREQGVENTATIENLLGSGRELWDSDEEFEEFMRFLEASRKDRG